MTTGYKFGLKGLDEYLEKVADAGANVDPAADEAIMAGCEVLQKDMVNRVPVLTGNLRDHVQIDGPHEEGNYHFAVVGVLHSVNFTDAETARYGNVIEYGSPSVQAQPYIRPAFDSKKAAVRKAEVDVLKSKGVL